MKLQRISFVRTSKIFDVIGKILAADRTAVIRISDVRFQKMQETFESSSYYDFDSEEPGLIFYKREKKMNLLLYVEEAKVGDYGWHKLCAIQELNVSRNAGETYLIF